VCLVTVVRLPVGECFSSGLQARIRGQRSVTDCPSAAARWSADVHRWPGTLCGLQVIARSYLRLPVAPDLRVSRAELQHRRHAPDRRHCARSLHLRSLLSVM
jgi:hypothetical protein